MSSNAADPVTLEIANAVARVSLNRPDAGNAMDAPLGRALRDVAESLQKRDDVRAVLLSGDGPRFCVGGDLSYFASSEDIGAALQSLAGDVHAAVEAFAALDAPVVAAVHGAAAGAGLSLVAGADLVIASETTKFTMAYTAAGLSPDGGATWFLPRVIGHRRTAEMAITNRALTAAEALDWGLVTQVVADDELRPTAEKLAERIASGPTAAFGTVKRLLNASSNATLKEQLADEADGIVANSVSADGREGVAAFLEKRRPNFVGRRIE